MPQYSGMWTLSQVSQAVKNQTWTGLPPSVVEYLVVAGGGGGTTYGGGGGAGGLLAGHAGITSGSSYFVTVGGGGAGVNTSANGTNGNNSVLVATTSGASTGNIVASGGGGGGYSQVTGNSGGCGGGGGGGTLGAVGGAGVSGQGNAGGMPKVAGGQYATGGGGGAGTIGLDTVSGSIAANGGAGVASAISGTVTTYAGGGAGSVRTNGTASFGGVGGGANGVTGNLAGINGTVNTGGGASSAGESLTGGTGGSGIVIIRYPGTTQFFTGGTLSYANGYMIHTFYANGTLVPIAGTLYANPDYQIARSLRFNSADTAYLSRTPGSATNRKTFTWSGWVKRSALPAAGVPIFSTEGTPYSQYLCFGGTDMTALTTDALCFFSPVSGSAFSVQSASVYRDVSAWYHIVCAVDTTQQTAANRVRLYVNGSEVSYGSSTYPAQNLDTYINSTGVTNIGSTAAAYFRGYITDVNFIDGQALTPSSFGWTNPATGVWAPLDFVGSYGTNGFNLNFSDNSNTTAGTLGADSSGNGNNFTPSGFSVSAGVGNDSLLDTPTPYGTDTGVGGEVRGNYCTWNPLSARTTTLTNGNLDGSTTSGMVAGTIGVSSGKWYWECTPTDTTTQQVFGIMSVFNTSFPTYPGGSADSYGYYGTSGNKYNNNSNVGYGSTFTNGDVIGVALDLDAGTLTFYKNNTSQGIAYSSLSGTFAPAAGDGATNAWTSNFGQRPFAYTAPSGYKALNTQNLPTPTIGATSATLANKFFNTVTYTATPGTGGTVSVGFQPDLLWVKNRDNVENHYWQDSVRGFSPSTGVTKMLKSNSTAVEASETGITCTTTSDGFTVVDSVPATDEFWYTNRTYVAWNWKASNASAVTNTSGSITSSVSASPASGFSIVRYSGNATSGATVGHGLGVAPSMIIAKTLNTAGYNWPVYHIGLTDASYVLMLDLTNGQSQQTNKWNSTAPTSTVVTLGDHGTNVSGTNNQILYCFAPIAGYSAFGSYTGNGSADGPFVHLGFRPRFLIFKRTDTSGAWFIEDSSRGTYNVMGPELYANSTDAEATSNRLDFLSNGFKMRAANAGDNASAGTYIYMAFAENPFKYSLAR